MTALQDAQATEWRDVAIGEIPEVIVYRDPRGTFTRSVTITFGAAVLIMLLVRGRTTAAVPFYGVGVFLPITIMGLAIRRHILSTPPAGRGRLGAVAALFSALFGRRVFVGQIVGKWEEGGWVVLISFSDPVPDGPRRPALARRLSANRGRSTASCASKARVRGAMASIVEWQSLRMQEYRYASVDGHRPLLGAVRDPSPGSL